VLSVPEVLLKRAPFPKAVFSLPVSFFSRAPDPVAVLATPEVFLERAAVPNAVLASPVLPELSGLTPTAVSSLPLAPTPAFGPSKKHSEQTARAVPLALNSAMTVAARTRRALFCALGFKEGLGLGLFAQKSAYAMMPILLVALA
jgi:hypothetical protein